MTTIEILKKARELLSDPTHWMKGGCNASHVREATAFCAWHAICKVNAPDYSEKLDNSTILLAFNFSRLIYLFGWNDAPERTHAEILQRFDEAIARLEAAG